MLHLFETTAVVLVVFAVLAVVDGLYLHLWKFRLHARLGAAVEHWIHTLRVLLSIPVLLFVLAGDTVGPALWLGVGFAVVDLGVWLWDAAVERTSRDFQGGLPGYEFGLHVVLTALHVGALILALVARPASAWAWNATLTASHAAAAAPLHDLVWHMLLPGTVLLAALHVALLRPAAAGALR